jgi:hypothetical protein
MVMNAVVLVVLGLLATVAVAFWIYAFLSLARTTTFSRPSRRAWFVVILLTPVAGPVAYFSAKKNVEKYAQPDPGRLPRLLKSCQR